MNKSARVAHIDSVTKTARSNMESLMSIPFFARLYEPDAEWVVLSPQGEIVSSFKDKQKANDMCKSFNEAIRDGLLTGELKTPAQVEESERILGFGKDE